MSKVAKKESFKFERGNTLTVNEHILADIKAQGFDHRWLNNGELTKFGGGHKLNFRPYQISDAVKTKLGSLAGFLGVGPDGFVRSHDLILGIREKEIGAQHRAHIEQRRRQLQKRTSKSSVARDMQAAMKSVGYDGRVISDEENDS